MAQKMPMELYVAIQEIKSICEPRESKSSCFEYGDYNYKSCIRHFLASSSEVAQLAVEPGSVRDLCEIMKILKKRRGVQFAVKGGGHGMAPKSSSTTGIHISMSRFSKIRYDQQTQTVEIGAGCLWDQVYNRLASTGRNVVGGASADGVGVAGWLLGGGYSLKSNRFGLGIDNIEEIEIVTPDGRPRRVNTKTNSDLFHALRGGGNNFGIVTKFTLKTFSQSSSYGSFFLISGNRKEEFKDALVSFVNTEERKEACVVAAFRHELVRGEVDPQYTISILCVFDAEKPKKKRSVPFQQFARLQENGETWKVDPVGWQLGPTRLSISDGSRTERRLPKPKRPPTRPSTPQSRNSGRGRNRNSGTPSDGAPPTYSDIFPRRTGRNRDVEDSDDGSDVEVATGYFQQMSFQELHGVCSEKRSVPPIEDVSDDDDSQSFDYGTDSSMSFDYDNSDWEIMDYDLDKKESVRKANSMAETDARWGLKYKGDREPVMMTKNIDKMGELSERGRFGCLMISTYTKPLLDKMAEEAENAASHLKKRRGIAVIVDAWPVHKAIFDNSPPGAAFPHKRGEPYGPMLAYFRWEKESDDDFWITKLKGTLNRIRVVARDLGLTPRKPAYYNNLSLESVPVHKIYRGNMDRLKKVKAKYDPTDVMGRCGGHKIRLSGDEDADSD